MRKSWDSFKWLEIMKADSSQQNDNTKDLVWRLILFYQHSVITFSEFLNFSITNSANIDFTYLDVVDTLFSLSHCVSRLLTVWVSPGLPYIYPMSDKKIGKSATSD